MAVLLYMSHFTYTTIDHVAVRVASVTYGI